MRDAACDAFFARLLACVLTCHSPRLQEFVASHVKGELQLAALKKLPTLRWRKQDKSEKEKGGGKKDKEGGGAVPLVSGSRQLYKASSGSRQL